MPQTLTSDMARKSLDVLLERIEKQPAFAPDESLELLASCEMGFLVLERLWHLAQGFLDHGMESRKLTFLFKELVDVIELGIRALDAASEKVKVADLTPQERAEGMSMLEDRSQRATRMRDELSALLRWLQTPPPEIALASLPGGRGEREAKGYIDLDDLTAHLLSGRDACSRPVRRKCHD